MAMATCPLCHHGSLRIIAASSPRESVITRLLRHLQLAAVLPPGAPTPVCPKPRSAGSSKPTTSRVGTGRRVCSGGGSLACVTLWTYNAVCNPSLQLSQTLPGLSPVGPPTALPSPSRCGLS